MQGESYNVKSSFTDPIRRDARYSFARNRAMLILYQAKKAYDSDKICLIGFYYGSQTSLTLTTEIAPAPLPFKVSA